MIGEKVRALRLKNGLGLVELGKHTGLSPALLSKLERGRLFPTLPTLLRIAMVFSVDLTYFFAGPREKPVVAVVRKADRIRLTGSSGPHGAYDFESLDFPVTERRMNAYLANFRLPGPKGPDMHAHQGAEFIYVISGSLIVRFTGEEHVLSEGDSIYFDPSRSHAYQRKGSRPCSALVVTSP
jgi:transcriptional regulator with XRE-family HTH domain